WLAFSRPLALSAGLLSLALFVLPPAMLGSIYADLRLGPALALLVIAALGVPPTAPKVAQLVVGGTALVLPALPAVVLSTAWTTYDREIGSVGQALDSVPRGSTVFAVTSEPYTRLLADTKERQAAWRPPLKHVASYAALRGVVFVPMTFADPTKQPLVVLPS